MDSKVSVIIPTYNRARLLVEALDSVYRQTRSDYEIIVVDDGSNDETPSRIAAYSERLVYHRTAHAGASAARNAGLDLACGQFIAFLDSDDVWESGFLETMLAALERAPDAGFSYCDYATFGAWGTVQAAYLPPRHKLSGNVFALLLDTDFLSTGALLIRRACFARVGRFDPTLAVAHDWDLWLRLAREFNSVYVDEPLVRIRIDSDGLTRHTSALMTDNLRILAKWRREADGNGQYRRLIRRNMAACHRSLFRYFWESRHPWHAFQQGVLMLRSELP